MLLSAGSLVNMRGHLGRTPVLGNIGVFREPLRHSNGRFRRYVREILVQQCGHSLSTSRGLHWDFNEEQGRNGFWVIGDGASFESTKSVMEYNTNPETDQPPLALPTLLRAHEPCPLVFESGLHDLRKLGYNCLIIKVSNVFLPNVEAPATEGPHYSSLCG